MSDSTLTLRTQVVDFGMTPLVRLTEVAPASGEKVPVQPVPVSVAVGGLATTKLVGRVSVKVT